MRKPGARIVTGNVAIPRIGAGHIRRIYDDRRHVSFPKLQTQRVMFLSIIVHRQPPELATVGLRLTRITFRVGWYDPFVLAIRGVHSHEGIADAYFLPLGLVTIQKTGARPSLVDGGQLPAKIDSVSNPGVHAESPRWA